MNEKTTEVKPSAYDLKELLKEIKSQGLEVAEDGAEVIYKAVMAWITKSALLSENKIDDIIVIAQKYIDDMVLPQIDKIDGKSE